MLYTIQDTMSNIPRYVRTLHSRYHRLPKVLWDLIWTYDDRFRVEFKHCVDELDRRFNHNRLMHRLTVDVPLYDIYIMVNNTRYPHNNLLSFPRYILARNKTYGDRVLSECLNHTTLRTHITCT